MAAETQKWCGVLRRWTYQWFWVVPPVPYNISPGNQILFLRRKENALSLYNLLGPLCPFFLYTSMSPIGTAYMPMYVFNHLGMNSWYLFVCECAFVCMYVYIYVSVQVYMCHGICMDITWQTLVSGLTFCIVWHPIFFFFFGAYHFIHRVCWSIFTSYLKVGRLRFTDVLDHSQIFHRSWALEQGPHTCAISTLPKKTISLKTAI